MRAGSLAGALETVLVFCHGTSKPCAGGPGDSASSISREKSWTYAAPALRGA